MLRLFVSVAVLAALAAGCGSDDPKPSAASAPTATPEHVEPAETDEHRFQTGHSAAVRKYYGDSHANSPEGDVEAEYHQPPRPAQGGIGDTITLTGSNIGVRMRVTVTAVEDSVSASRPPRAGKRYVAVKLRLRNTGIAVLDGEQREAVLKFQGGNVPVVLGVKADCSNGFDGTVRIGDEAPAKGCLLFELPRSARPRELQFALETVPAEVGGRWRLR